MINVHSIDTDKIKNRSVIDIRKRRRARQRKMSHFASKQPNFDAGEIYGLIAKKLEMLLDYAQTDSVISLEEWRLSWMKRAIALGKHLYKTESYPTHININNQSRFAEASDLQLQKMQNKYLNQVFYDIKAKQLFFNILNNYIDFWWD